MERGLGKVRRISKNGLARLGVFQTQQVESGRASGIAPPPRNVLVDERIAEAEFRQVPETSYQVDVFVAGVAVPSTNVAHWDHRPVFAKGPLC